MAILIELVINENKKGLKAISLVDKPAILTNFVKLAEEQEVKDIKFAVADEEQHIVLGPALIPNVKIYRSKKSLGLEDDAYVYFSEDTIKELAQIYMEELKIHEVTLDHESDTSDAKMIESWIIDDPQKDKSAVYGFDLAKGTWMVAFKILSDSLWKKIKEGLFNGFSIEADALAMIPKGEFSFSEEKIEDDRLDPNSEEFIELGKLMTDHCKIVGQTQEDFEKDGWELLFEDEEIDSDDILENEDALILSLAIESEPAAKSFLDQGNYAIRYKYVVAPNKGPAIIDTTRQFCRDMINANLIFRREDISQMSFRGENTIAKQNYSIFKYAGAWNCRHIFKRLIFIKSTNPNAGTVIPGYKKGTSSDGPPVTEEEKIAATPKDKLFYK